MDLLLVMFYLNVAGVVGYFVTDHFNAPSHAFHLEDPFEAVLEERTHDWDPIVKRYARLYGLDWRFVYAIIYTESRFEKDAISYAGAVGLMQVLPKVASEQNVQDLFAPHDNIKAGVRHFYQYVHRLKAHTRKDQLRMALAAYNGGIGHVYDAKRLAQQRGLDPYTWDSIAKVLPDLEKEEVHASSRHGYCQGSNMVRYVETIEAKYQQYKKSYPERPLIRTTQPQAPIDIPMSTAWTVSFLST